MYCVTVNIGLIHYFLYFDSMVMIYIVLIYLAITCTACELICFSFLQIYQTAYWCMENGLLPHAIGDNPICVLSIVMVTVMFYMIIIDTDDAPMCDFTFVFPVAALKEKYSLLKQR